MRKNSFLYHALKREAFQLYQESIVNRCLGWIYNDKVQVLQRRPLAMFFYNLRAISLGCGLIYLVVFWLLLLLLPRSAGMVETGLVLSGFWLLDTFLTASLHKSFVKKLDSLAKSRPPNEFPLLFHRYFLLDSFVVLALIVASRIFKLNLDAFASLLFANMMVYSAYAGARKINPLIITISFLAVMSLMAILMFFIGVQIIISGPYWFSIMLYAGPLLAMSLLTVLPVAVIPWLRTIEHEVILDRLKLLGEFETILSEPITRPPTGKSELNKGRFIEQQFGKQVEKVLKRLCSLDSPFWYSSACLWFMENHQDRETAVFLPGAFVNFNEARQCKDGIEAAGLLSRDQITLLHSIQAQQDEYHVTAADFRYDLDAPAAFIPLRRDDRQIGVLALYGKEGGPPLQDQEEAFLRSLGSIIFNTMEQWEGRYRAFPQREMEELFKCESLSEVFTKTAKIMQEYLVAAGCMVIFRPETDKDEMHVSDKVGFTNIIKTSKYEVGKGQTGMCAATGKPIRWDNVPLHRSEFDADLLDVLEAAHKKPIISWMAIPIGPRKRNYGVIKVVNRTSRCSWFRDEDEQLGISLALRLQVIIEKFKFIEEVVAAKQEAEDGRAEAQLQSKKASLEQKNAEQTAFQRQEDLMIITHQLQGPLVSLIGTISYLQTKPAAKSLKELEMLEALVEDGIALCYGTFTTFALGAAQKTSFDADYIDAPEEMQKLCERLQKTNKRPDLTFTSKREAAFPKLYMDKDVFTSVLYSLVHNAMKYADKHSEVELECSFERKSGEAALKVKSKGEPILMAEVDTIFEKFGRGQIHQKTGRHHSGVGLGLWVARGLMEAIGGNLTLELSPEHSRLSVFVMHIPISKNRSGDDEPNS